MRPDMAKIIVERPRPSRRDPRGRDGRRFRDSSDAQFLPMKAGYRELKSLNENLRPLARYLAQQTGRPWDAVYRDVRAVIDGRSAVQCHILEHLPQYVAMHTRVVDGQLIDVGAAILGVRRVWQPLYVHPRTGLLLRNPDDLSWRVRSRERARSAERQRATVWRELSPECQLHCLDGDWFAVGIAPLPEAPAAPLDAVRRRHIWRHASDTRRTTDDREAKELYGRSGVYAAWKRQLNAREIRAHSLR